MPREDLLKPNLRITFFVGDGEFELDDNGNPVEKTSNLIVHARVSQSTNPIYYQMPGITITDIVVRGVIVSQCNKAWIASSLPKSINLEVPAEGSLRLFDRSYSGKFRFIPTVQSVFKSLNSRFGERIRGYLKVSSRN